MTPRQASLAVPRDAPEPTHPCIRCGREGVPADAGLCELCNPLELSQPSATQMHGIAALGIIVFVVILAVAGRAAIAGTGPFTGRLVGVSPSADGLAVTIVVDNQGRNASATTCTVTETPPRVGGPSQVVQTPLVPATSSIEFTAIVTKFGATPVDLVASCQSP